MHFDERVLGDGGWVGLGTQGATIIVIIIVDITSCSHLKEETKHVLDDPNNAILSPCRFCTGDYQLEMV